MESISLEQASTEAARIASYTGARAEVIRMVPVTARRILDMGCSNGALGGALKAQVPGRTVHGIEYDAAFAEHARGILDHVVHGNLDDAAWHETLGDAQYDCLVMADVLEHLVSPEQCLARALSHLAPGGSVVLSLPNIRHVSALRSIYFGGRFPRRTRGIFDQTHLRWFTPGDALALAEGAGLAIRQTDVALRWTDKGGARIDRLLNRLPVSMQRRGPLREFLAYQFLLRAERA